MRKRKQKGHITQRSGQWYLRYNVRRMENGIVVRHKATHCLGSVTGRSKYPPPEIEKAAELHMQTVNESTIPVEQVVSLATFVETVYLPWIKSGRRASTYKNYRDIWQLHVKDAARMLLRDIRCRHIQGLLDKIAKKALSRNSLKRIKSMLTGVFDEAKRLGYFDGENPVKGARVDPQAPAPKETYAYDLAEIRTLLGLLPEPAATVFAVASYGGLRRGEIEALAWSDYHDGALHVARSAWHGFMNAPKTEASRNSVPVIKQLAERLDHYRLRSGNPESGPMFVNSAGERLSLDNVRNRVILPILNRCVHCGVSEGRPHEEQDHEYERDERLPAWHGWHAARRGLGSNLYRLGVPDKVIQRILRHSNVKTTLDYYVKSTSSDVLAGMQKLEQRLAETPEESAGQQLWDTNRTPKPGSGAMPEIVN